MKGIFNLKPSLPKHVSIWDPSTVLKYLETLGPYRKIPLKLLTLKVATLLALLTVQRVQTLHALCINNISFTDEFSELLSIHL